MGLDMYAYTIDARLVESEGQTDVRINKIARRAVGFIDLSEYDIKKLDHDGVHSYFKKRIEADKKAAEEGWVNTDFWYWRKFNNLHGWMERLYTSKGGRSSFNCTTVRINAEDLDRLEQDAATLRPVGGFFWGSTEEMNQQDIDEVKSFIARAREAIAAGKAVFYDSWW